MCARKFVHLVACGLIFGSCAAISAEESACHFDLHTLSFDGTPKEQALCLLRPIGRKGIVGEPLQSLPLELPSIGERVELSITALRRYLTRIHIPEEDLGGALDEPLSRTEAGVVAEYFVIHDTSAPKLPTAPTFPSKVNTAELPENSRSFWASSGESHVYITRIGESVAARAFSVPWRATQLELKLVGRPSRGRFLHVENVQPRMRDPSGPPNNDYNSPDPGFTDAQLHRLALVYIAASARRGRWMIPAYHGVLDIGVGDHDDPQHFDLQKWATIVHATISEINASAH